MATKFLPVVPPFVGDAGVSEILKRVTLNVKSDPVNFNSDTAVNIFEVPGNIVITNLYVDIVTAYEASGTSAAATATIEVPGSSGAVIAWDAGNTRLQVFTDTGLSPDSLAGPIKVPASGGMIVVKTDPGTTLTGQMEVYVRYIPDQTLL